MSQSRPRSGSRSRSRSRSRVSEREGAPPNGSQRRKYKLRSNMNPGEARVNAQVGDMIAWIADNTHDSKIIALGYVDGNDMFNLERGIHIKAAEVSQLFGGKSQEEKRTKFFEEDMLDALLRGDVRGGSCNVNGIPETKVIFKGNHHSAIYDLVIDESKKMGQPLPTSKEAVAAARRRGGGRSTRRKRKGTRRH